MGQLSTGRLGTFIVIVVTLLTPGRPRPVSLFYYWVVVLLREDAASNPPRRVATEIEIASGMPKLSERYLLI
ncbi:hypothetical protein D3C80_1933590 [compost metagenome]